MFSKTQMTVEKRMIETSLAIHHYYEKSCQILTDTQVHLLNMNLKLSLLRKVEISFQFSSEIYLYLVNFKNK